MYRMTRKQKYETDRARMMERLGLTQEEYNRFRYLGTCLHTIYERQCNGYPDYQGNWDYVAEEKDNKREESFTNKVLDLAEEKDLHVYIQTDPRGGTIYLSKNPISENSYSTQAELIY